MRFFSWKNAKLFETKFCVALMHTKLCVSRWGNFFVTLNFHEYFLGAFIGNLRWVSTIAGISYMIYIFLKRLTFFSWVWLVTCQVNIKLILDRITDFSRDFYWYNCKLDELPNYSVVMLQTSFKNIFWNCYYFFDFHSTITSSVFVTFKPESFFNCKKRNKNFGKNFISKNGNKFKNLEIVDFE